MKAICDEFEAYGYRRLRRTPPSRHVVNAKSVVSARHALIQAAGVSSRRPIAITIIRSSRSRDKIRWMAPTNSGGRHHLCRNRDWLRVLGRDPRCLVPSVVGYAISRSIDARLVVAALKAASRSQPAVACIIPTVARNSLRTLSHRFARHGLVGRWSARQSLRQRQG